jgi:hypothetical protein
VPLDDAVSGQYASGDMRGPGLLYPNTRYRPRPFITRRPNTLISQLRIYTINQGQMDSWLKAFEGLKPIMAEHGIQVDGTWVDEENQRFIWIRSFADQADLEKKEAAFYSSEKWLAGVDHVRSHLARREITVINPA